MNAKRYIVLLEPDSSYPPSWFVPCFHHNGSLSFCSNFSYQIGLLLPLDQIFFGVIFLTERLWNVLILKVGRSISESYWSGMGGQIDGVIGQSKGIKQIRTGPRSFDICFYVIFSCSGQGLISGKETEQ